MESPQAGPMVLGAKAGLAVGAYTSIEAIIAPAEASPNQAVSVEVKVQNTTGYAIYIAATAVQDSAGITISPDYVSVDPGATQSFYGSFLMPDKAVRVSVWSFYWDGTSWVQDDSAYKDVALKVISPQFSGFGIADYNKT